MQMHCSYRLTFKATLFLKQNCIVNFASMHDVVIKIVNTSENILPEYATAGSSGMDIRASLTNAVTLQPLERVLISTGIFLEIPAGYEGQVRPRSGLALNRGLTCLNSPGTIDSDYRGELKIILINLSSEKQTINTGERIAQLVISKVEKALFQPVMQLESSIRNDGGFGHTGSV